jgi:hypothetical protein
MATKKYKTFTPVVTTSAVLSTVPNVDGQLVVTKDGGGIYYDDGTNRTLVSKDSTKLSSSGTATQASKAYNTYASVGTSGKYYYPLSTISASSAYIQPAAVGDVKVYEVGNSSATGYSQLMLGNSSSGTSKRIGKIQLYGSSSGTTTITPGNSTTTANTLTLPSTTGTLLTSESAAGTYLPLTGGTLSGDLFVGDSSKTTESKLGVRSTAGGWYLYSNADSGSKGLWDEDGNAIVSVGSDGNVQYIGGTVNNNLLIKKNLTAYATIFAGNSTITNETAVGVNSTAGGMFMVTTPDTGRRGLWDINAGDYVWKFDSSNNLTYKQGTFNGDIGISSARSTINDTTPTVPCCFTTDSALSAITDVANYKTFFGTAVIDSKWWQIISIRHRNGLGDGATYGMYIKTVMDGTGGLVYQCQASTWKGEKTILDSSNWGNYATKAYYGTSTPSSSTGKNGDIYLVYSS